MEGGAALLRRSPRFLATPSFPASFSMSSSSSPPLTPMSAALTDSDFLDHSAFPPNTPAVSMSLSAPTGRSSATASSSSSSSSTSASRSPLPQPASTDSLLSPPLSALGAMGLMRAMNKNDSSDRTHSNASAMLRRRNSRRGSTAPDSFSSSPMMLSQSPLQLSMNSPLLSFDTPSHQPVSHPSIAAVSSPLDSPAIPSLSAALLTTPTVSSSLAGTGKRGTRSAQLPAPQPHPHYASFLTSPSPPSFSQPLPRRSPRFHPSSNVLSSMPSPGLFASSPSFSFSLPSPSFSSLPSSSRVKREADDALLPPSPLTSALDPNASPASVSVQSLSSPNRSIMRSIYSLSSATSSPPFEPAHSTGGRKRRRKSEDAKLSAMFPQFTPPLHPEYAPANNVDGTSAASAASGGSGVSFNLLEMNGLSPAFHPLSAYSHSASSSATNGHTVTPDSTPSSTSVSVDSSYGVHSPSSAVNGQSAPNSDGSGLGSSCHQCKSRRALSQLIFCCNMFASNSNARKQAAAAAAAEGGTSTPSSSAFFASPSSKPSGSTNTVNAATVKVEKKGICRKKYCGACLGKFYGEKPPPEALRQSPLSTWQCPSCRHMCCCAACRRQKLKRGALAADDDKSGMRAAASNSAAELRPSDIASMDVHKLISYAIVYLPQFATELIGKHKQKKKKHNSTTPNKHNQPRDDSDGSTSSSGSGSDDSSEHSNRSPPHTTHNSGRQESSDDTPSQHNDEHNGSSHDKKQKVPKDKLRVSREKRVEAKKALKKRRTVKQESAEGASSSSTGQQRQQQQIQQQQHERKTTNGSIDSSVATTSSSASSTSVPPLSSSSVGSEYSVSGGVTDVLTPSHVHYDEVAEESSSSALDSSDSSDD